MHALLAILIGIIIGYIVAKYVIKSDDKKSSDKKPSKENFDIGANSYIGSVLENEINNPQYFG
jgi:hypothetical protein